MKKKIKWVLTEAPKHAIIEQEVDSFGSGKNRRTPLPVYEKTVNPNGAGYIEKLGVTIINDGREVIKVYAIEEGE